VRTALLIRGKKRERGNVSLSTHEKKKKSPEKGGDIKVLKKKGSDPSLCPRGRGLEFNVTDRIKEKKNRD